LQRAPFFIPRLCFVGRLKWLWQAAHRASGRSRRKPLFAACPVYTPPFHDVDPLPGATPSCTFFFPKTSDLSPPAKTVVIFSFVSMISPCAFLPPGNMHQDRRAAKLELAEETCLRPFIFLGHAFPFSVWLNSRMRFLSPPPLVLRLFASSSQNKSFFS